MIKINLYKKNLPAAYYPLSMKKFGKLEKVDLRELWRGRIADFNLWLSEEDNIVELGQVTGMELQIQKQEIKGGVSPG